MCRILRLPVPPLWRHRQRGMASLHGKLVVSCVFNLLCRGAAKSFPVNAPRYTARALWVVVVSGWPPFFHSCRKFFCDCWDGRTPPSVGYGAWVVWAENHFSVVPLDGWALTSLSTRFRTLASTRSKNSLDTRVNPCAGRWADARWRASSRMDLAFMCFMVVVDVMVGVHYHTLKAIGTVPNSRVQA